MAKPKIPIADALIQVMDENGARTINCGDFGLLDDAYERAYGNGNGQRTRNPHPRNRHQALMDAARRSDKFVLVGRIRHCGWSGRETLHPLYRIAGRPVPRRPGHDD